MSETVSYSMRGLSLGRRDVLLNLASWPFNFSPSVIQTLRSIFMAVEFGKLPFPFKDHGLLRPSELNKIYNRCFAGLSLSMTNVSLVPHEMLSAGCIPVVNAAEHNRIVLDNSFVRYASPTPHALADALSDVQSTKDFASYPPLHPPACPRHPGRNSGRVAEESIRRALISPVRASQALTSRTG